MQYGEWDWVEKENEGRRVREGRVKGSHRWVSKVKAIEQQVTLLSGDKCASLVMGH